MRWRDPKDFAIVMGKILGALAGAMLLTGLLTVILPYSDYTPKTPERFLAVSVFYAVWLLLIFKFMFGRFIPINIFKTSGQ
ncbi:hypothetical protein Halru_0896 [Halovivax ruber XH-70]|uniref:Uncharacterized protein n=1 Tax=Halovivax ruber (strain DSM 18193 / JCM 13892 / XH-70) TaxID=797302 RepID=L0I9X0_HALRX|nr:hypothetical protein [Halovivax ruber]AGB15519.1 hypothetical protein Halru_0896 [Halovivax ruber XH-70]